MHKTGSAISQYFSMACTRNLSTMAALFPKNFYSKAMSGSAYSISGATQSLKELSYLQREDYFLI